MENYTISERLFSNNQASIWEVARKIIEEHYYPNNNAQAQSLTKGDDKTAYNRLVVSIRTKNSLPPNSQYIPIEKRNISIPSMSEFQSFIPNQEGTSQAGTYVIPSGLFSNNQASIWAVARKIIEEHYYPNNREQAELLITGQNKAPYNYLIVQIRQRNNLETKAEYISISKQSINIPTLSDFERQLIPGNTRQSSQTQINTAAAGTEKTIIVIDPGHGVRGTDGGSNMRWFDSGATNPPKATREKADYLESVITLDISQKLKLAIKNKIPNVEVFLTREKEIDLLDEKNYSEYTKISSTISKDKLSFRSEFALAKKADYFISIHCNDSP